MLSALFVLAVEMCYVLHFFCLFINHSNAFFHQPPSFPHRTPKHQSFVMAVVLHSSLVHDSEHTLVDASKYLGSFRLIHLSSFSFLFCPYKVKLKTFWNVCNRQTNKVLKRNVHFRGIRSNFHELVFQVTLLYHPQQSHSFPVPTAVCTFHKVFDFVFFTLPPDERSSLMM